MAYPGYGAPPPGGYGGVSEEGLNCFLVFLRKFQRLVNHMLAIESVARRRHFELCTIRIRVFIF